MKNVYRQPLFRQLRDDWLRGAMRSDFLALIDRAEAVLGALAAGLQPGLRFFPRTNSQATGAGVERCVHQRRGRAA